MISGFFGDEDSLFFEIELISSDGLELPVDALFDTGFELYLGKVIFGGQEYDIPVHVGEGLTEVLLGRQWLQNKRLVVDMPSSVLTLG